MVAEVFGQRGHKLLRSPPKGPAATVGSRTRREVVGASMGQISRGQTRDRHRVRIVGAQLRRETRSGGFLRKVWLCLSFLKVYLTENEMTLLTCSSTLALLVVWTRAKEVGIRKLSPRWKRNGTGYGLAVIGGVGTKEIPASGAKWKTKLEVKEKQHTSAWCSTSASRRTITCRRAPQDGSSREERCTRGTPCATRMEIGRYFRISPHVLRRWRRQR